MSARDTMPPELARGISKLWDENPEYILNEKIERAASLLNKDIPMPYSFTYSFRDSLASTLQSLLGSSPMEMERLKTISNLNDEQWQEAIKNGIVTPQEALLFERSGATSNDRNEIMRKRLERETGWNSGVKNITDYIAAPNHEKPQGFLEHTTDFLASATPDVGMWLAEYLTLSPLAMIGLNTMMGHNAANEQVYSNLRNQGKSVADALKAAKDPVDNLRDLVLRFGTGALTRRALGKAVNPYNWSPIMQTLRNIGIGAAISGAGSAGEQAFTNYRSNVDNSLGGLAKTGAVSAATTGLFGLGTAATNWRNLLNAQRLWKANRPINVEYNFKDVPPEDNTPQFGGENTPPNQPSSPGGPGGETPVPPDEINLDQLHRYNDSITRMGASLPLMKISD